MLRGWYRLLDSESLLAAWATFGDVDEAYMRCHLPNRHAKRSISASLKSLGVAYEASMACRKRMLWVYCLCIPRHNGSYLLLQRPGEMR
jgi:hypothetical protein